MPVSPPIVASNSWPKLRLKSVTICLRSLVDKSHCLYSMRSLSVAPRPTILKLTLPGRTSKCSPVLSTNLLLCNRYCKNSCTCVGNVHLLPRKRSPLAHTSLPEQLYIKIGHLQRYSPNCSMVLALSLPVTRYTS